MEATSLVKFLLSPLGLDLPGGNLNFNLCFKLPEGPGEEVGVNGDSSVLSLSASTPSSNDSIDLLASSLAIQIADSKVR